MFSNNLNLQCCQSFDSCFFQKFRVMSNFIYKCFECEEVFCKKFDLSQHKNIHCNETPFMCINCRKSFRLIKEYVDHIKCKLFTLYDSFDKLEPGKARNDLKKTDYTSCKKCFEVFENFQDFRSHFCSQNNNPDVEETKNSSKCECCACQINYSQIKESLRKYSGDLKCKNCNKKFSSTSRLSNHSCFVSSSGENFKCSCLLTFKTASAFKVHVGKKPYSCCNCLMQFNTITNLIRHIRTHTKQKPYICKDCGRGFSQSANLRNHSSVHLGVRAMKCNECNFSCKTLNGLIKHKKKHNEGLNHQNYVDGRKKSSNKSICPICNKQFMFKRNMGMHMKIHDNKVSLCTECGKVFDSKSKLSSHCKACHKEPSVCKKCGKVFASAVLLSAHEKIHVSDKLFSCEFCQKTFSIKNYLVQHMKTHSNKKQFSCSKCGKLFKVAVSLKYHSNICTSLNIPV